MYKSKSDTTISNTGLSQDKGSAFKRRGIKHCFGKTELVEMKQWWAEAGDDGSLCSTGLPCVLRKFINGGLGWQRQWRTTAATTATVVRKD